MRCDICHEEKDVIYAEDGSVALCLNCQTQIADYEDEQKTKNQDLY